MWRIPVHTNLCSDETTIDVFGISVEEPVTVLTDLIITLVCWILFFHTSKKLPANRVTSLYRYFFFVMGLTHPILETGYSIGNISLSHDFIYISDSFRYFTNKGDWFIGGLLLFFTIIFPIIKYIFLALTLSGIKLPKQKSVGLLMDAINKWAMLDVFVVAVLILNLKMDSDMVISELQKGTTYFAISILLMMICSFINQRLISTRNEA